MASVSTRINTHDLSPQISLLESEQQFVIDLNIDHTKDHINDQPSLNQHTEMDHVSSNDAHPTGSIKLYIGCMFAAKSSHMCADVEKYNIANKLCIIIRYEDDTRYDNLAASGGLVTHAHREHHRVLSIKAKTLASISEFIDEYEVVGVDEAQFFPDCVEMLQKWANSGKIIIASGLDGNYLAKPFGRIAELIPLCEKVIKLQAVCMKCCADASFTHRIIASDEEVLIGGADQYIAVCRMCMFKS